tara:strand:- start:87 stop:1001 length:915 start_codon:yes stop_codon:yes gene_type:complete
LHFFSQKIKPLIISCRPNQWTKNLLVFAAPIFGLNLDNEVLVNSLLALICFCLISSSVYLLNDSIDIKEDRLHPLKKYRPIAAGLIKIKEGLLFSFLFFLISSSIAFIFSKILFIIIISYSIIQFSYCLKLKNIPLLDLFCISSGFLLRAIAGGISSNIILTQWFLLTIGLLALFLAVEKRKSELIQFQNNNKMTRKVIKQYSLPLLLRIESLSANSAFISYSLWATGPLLNGATNRWMIITVPIVLYGIFRYQLLSDPNQIISKRSGKVQLSAQNPEEILLKDKGIQITIILWLITALIIFKS